MASSRSPGRDRLPTIRASVAPSAQGAGLVGTREDGVLTAEYVVIYEQAENGAWGAYLPDIPGVVGLGATRDEVAERIEEAFVALAEDLRGRGDRLPAPRHFAGTVVA